MHPLSIFPLPKGVLKEPSRVKQPLLGLGHWLADKDILCRLTQELCHKEIDEPRAWTEAVVYVQRLSKCMRKVESGTTMENMA